MIAVYAGSFDPPTLGHIDVIVQARRLFGGVHVLVARNAEKGARLMASDVAARLISGCAQVTASVLPPGRYVADYVAELYGPGSACLVRGLRDASDMGPEIAIRRANEIIGPRLPTAYVLASPSVAHISSTAVRDLIGFDGWQKVVAQYVPPSVLAALDG